MKGNRSRMILAMALICCSLTVAYAFNSYLTSFNTTYPNSPLTRDCNICHTSGYGLNAYASDFAANGQNFSAIQDVDSDKDGFSNIAEINAGSNPGDAASTPADNAAPVVSLTAPATSASLTVAITVSATDNVAVTGYLVNENATAPAAGASGWNASAPTGYTFAAAGSKTLYAWAKDAAGNVGGQSKSVAITLPDSAAPVVSLTAPAASDSLTVAITVSATDNVAVTGYLVNENATAPAAGAPGWNASAPTGYTFAAAGSKTLYAWAKDAAGNVGGQSKPVAITLPDSAAPVVSLTAPATSASLTVAITVSATDNVAVTGYLVNENATAPAAGAPGWNASAPTGYTFSAAGSKTLYAWAKDAAGNVGGQSKPITVTITDTIAPIVTSFSIPTTSTSLTVEITSFSASDNVAVTGYMVTEGSTPPVANSANWISRAPTSHTFSEPGNRVLHAWAKDTAGNISEAKSAQTVISTSGQDLSGMKVWQGKWFKLMINKEGESRRIGYMNALTWDEDGQSLRCLLYTNNDGSQWESSELLLHYTSGNPTRFLGWFDYTDQLTFVFRIAGMLGRDGSLKRASINAVGQAVVVDTAEDDSETEDESESDDDQAFTIFGTMISDKRVPEGIRNPRLANDDVESDEVSSKSRRLRHKEISYH